uniref:hypothetical protein n=1 Tax=Thaumasiovibrio occultus TaxID=1891184 RepID=UPI000B351918|nr:hypothetical protein [Thaumasiovibrio occultus]
MFARWKSRWSADKTESISALPGSVLHTNCYSLAGMGELDPVRQQLRGYCSWVNQHLTPGTTPFAQGETGFDHVSMPMSFKHLASDAMSDNHLPVIVANCHASVLDVLAGLESRAGVININHHLLLQQTLQLEARSVFHFALSQWPSLSYLAIGVDEKKEKESVLEYADSLDCYWFSEQQCRYRYSRHLLQQVEAFVGGLDQVVLNIDLKSLVTDNPISGDRALNIALVAKIVKQCLASKKIVAVHVVGEDSATLGSEEALRLLDVINSRRAM